VLRDGLPRPRSVARRKLPLLTLGTINGLYLIILNHVSDLAVDLFAWVFVLKVFSPN
jgi:hypothetical protein